eukprot:228876-Karenia_brevis.AAC.1
MKRDHFTGAFHCFCEEEQYLYSKAILLHAHGRTDEATSVIHELQIHMPLSNSITDMRRAAHHTWVLMSHDEREPYREQYRRMIHDMSPRIHDEEVSNTD